jgi:hypothetical protein
MLTRTAQSAPEPHLPAVRRSRRESFPPLLLLEPITEQMSLKRLSADHLGESRLCLRHYNLDERMPLRLYLLPMCSEHPSQKTQVVCASKSLVHSLVCVSKLSFSYRSHRFVLCVACKVYVSHRMYDVVLCTPLIHEQSCEAYYECMNSNSHRIRSARIPQGIYPRV